MKFSALGFLLLVTPGLALAQDTGVALNAGRGLENGASIDWTFKEDWTLRPTMAAGYSQQTGFQARLGSTVLRSFGAGHRAYPYLGAGAYYTTGIGNGRTTLTGPNQIGGGGSNARSVPTGATNGLSQNQPSAFYLTAPIGVRARLFSNFEAFAEGAYQKTLSGQFGIDQTGQFSGNQHERLGATMGISLRLR